MRISDWSSDVCSSDLQIAAVHIAEIDRKLADLTALRSEIAQWGHLQRQHRCRMQGYRRPVALNQTKSGATLPGTALSAPWRTPTEPPRSEEHPSELQSLMRISYAVFCLKTKQHAKKLQTNHIYRSNCSVTTRYKQTTNTSVTKQT